MKAYIITEAEKDAVLKELELEKLLSPRQMDGYDPNSPHEFNPKFAIDAIHRRFHYIVSKLLS